MNVSKHSFATKRWRLYIFHRQVAQKYAGKKNGDQKKNKGYRNFVEGITQQLLNLVTLRMTTNCRNNTLTTDSTRQKSKPKTHP